MKNLYIYCLILLIASFAGGQVRAQGYLNETFSPAQNFEFGITAGANNFLGDLGGNLGKGKDFLKDYQFKTIRPLLGVSLNYYPLRWLNVNTGINFTKVTGADSLIHNENGAERWRYNRNLSFKSSIFEAYAGVEVYFLNAASSRFDTKRINPYVGLGIGIFHFNPKAQYNGQWVDLQPLRLEGEGFAEYPNSKPYKLWEPYVPITGGIKYNINDKVNLLAGMLIRVTGTDHIDDVSGYYIDPTLFNKYLSPAQANLAKNLYSRSKTPWKVKPGIDRADQDNNRSDSYVTFFLTLRFTLSSTPTYYDCWKP